MLTLAGIVVAVVCVIVVFAVFVPQLENLSNVEEDLFVPEITQALGAENSQKTELMESTSTTKKTVMVTLEETKAEETAETTISETESEGPKPHEDPQWGEKVAANYSEPYVEENVEQREDPTLLESQKVGLQNISVGGSVLFGEYEQDEELSNGPEEIEWLVLDEDGNGRYLLLSKLVLDMKPYYAEYSPFATWDGSTARYWLNGAFLNKAFPSSEQALIPEVLVENPGNAQFGTYGGEDTKDRCFLLSAEEIYRYLPTDESRKADYTSYVDRLQQYQRSRGVDFMPWVIRTPGSYTNLMSVIGVDGREPYIPDYTLEEIIEEIENDESLSEAKKKEEIELYKTGKASRHRLYGSPQFFAAGMRPALWVDISGL